MSFYLLSQTQSFSWQLCHSFILIVHIYMISFIVGTDNKTVASSNTIRWNYTKLKYFPFFLQFGVTQKNWLSIAFDTIHVISFILQKMLTHLMCDLYLHTPCSGNPLSFQFDCCADRTTNWLHACFASFKCIKGYNSYVSTYIYIYKLVTNFRTKFPCTIICL